LTGTVHVTIVIHNMTIAIKPKTMAAGVFKAKCLAVLDRVQKKREGVVITKRGKPVARVVPLENDDGNGLPLALPDPFVRAAEVRFDAADPATDVAGGHDRYLEEVWGGPSR